MNQYLLEIERFIFDQVIPTVDEDSTKIIKSMIDEKILDHLMIYHMTIARLIFGLEEDDKVSDLFEMKNLSRTYDQLDKLIKSIDEDNQEAL